MWGMREGLEISTCHMAPTHPYLSHPWPANLPCRDHLIAHHHSFPPALHLRPLPRPYPPSFLAVIHGCSSPSYPPSYLAVSHGCSSSGSLGSIRFSLCLELCFVDGLDLSRGSERRKKRKEVGRVHQKVRAGDSLGQCLHVGLVRSPNNLKTKVWRPRE